MYLLVVVSQWHERLIYRCYDFESGDVREAVRPEPHVDAELIKDFAGLPKNSRDMQLQVSLADLVVFDVPHRTGGQGAVDPPAPGNEDSVPLPSNATPGMRSAPGFTWGVRFEEEGSGPIVVTTDASMYDKEVEAQMAAAAAKVDKRLENARKAKEAARERDRKIRARVLEQEAKRKAKLARMNKRRLNQGDVEEPIDLPRRGKRRHNDGDETSSRGNDDGDRSGEESDSV